MKNVFIQGPIHSDFISKSIARHQSKTDIDAHNIYLRQVQAKESSERSLKAIEFIVREEEANIINEIREIAFEKYSLSCMHIYLSVGVVNLGEIYAFVFVSSPKRSEVFGATEFLVKEIENRVSVTQKEIFELREDG